MIRLQTTATRWWLRAAPASRRPERGDVPGWVLITLMTALLVTVLYAVAKEQLIALFNQAMSTVTGIK